MSGKSPQLVGTVFNSVERPELSPEWAHILSAYQDERIRMRKALFRIVARARLPKAAGATSRAQEKRAIGFSRAARREEMRARTNRQQTSLGVLARARRRMRHRSGERQRTTLSGSESFLQLVRQSWLRANAMAPLLADLDL